MNVLNISIVFSVVLFISSTVDSSDSLNLNAFQENEGSEYKNNLFSKLNRKKRQEQIEVAVEGHELAEEAAKVAEKRCTP